MILRSNIHLRKICYLHKKNLKWIVKINKIFIDEILDIKLFKTMVRRFFFKHIDDRKKSYAMEYESKISIPHDNIDVICLITVNDTITIIIQEINDYYNLRRDDYCNNVELDSYHNKYGFLLDFVIKNSRLMGENVYNEIHKNINKEIFPMVIFNMYNYDSLPEEIKVDIYGNK